jgi:hypothetical protein
LRRNRTGLKRIGLLALALVIAMGSLGVAYAAWSDTIYVGGTVNTGTVDIDGIQGLSMFVYKVPGAEDTGYGPETVVIEKTGPDPPTSPPENGILIASATAEFTNNDSDTAEMHFSGLFPEFDFQAGLEMKYGGTIPVKVYIAEIAPLEPGDVFYDSDEAALIQELWQLGIDTKGDETRYGIWIDARVTPFGGTEGPKVDPLGEQLHKNDTAVFTVHIRLPQDPPAGSDYQNLTDVNFTGTITVIQWNEYDDEE